MLWSVSRRASPNMKPITIRAVFFEAILLLLAWGIGYLIKIPVWQQAKLTGQALLWGILATLPLFAGLIWTVRTQSPRFAELRQFVQQYVVPLFAGCSLWEMALIALIAGVGEELLFRGLIQTGLTAVTSLWPGLLLASLIFGLLHYITRLYAILAALIGLYLGFLFITFDNLAVAMIVHTLYDFVALIYLVRMNR